jgi:hypothetical protein
MNVWPSRPIVIRCSTKMIVSRFALTRVPDITANLEEEYKRLTQSVDVRALWKLAVSGRILTSPTATPCRIEYDRATLLSEEISFYFVGSRCGAF